MKRLPMIQELLQRLFRRTQTNPFPARRLPKNMGAFLQHVESGCGRWHPPVPVPEDARCTLAYDAQTCIGCGICISFCPAHAIERVPKTKKIRVFLGQCIACGQCVEVCPKKSLTMTNDFLKTDSDRYSQALVLE